MTHPFSDKIPALLQAHYEHLKKSAITDEVIAERGYKSILGTKALIDTGFSKSQRRCPGILIPIHGVDGSIVGHQYRPDRPRTGDKGKVIKYENPTGSTIRLDVPPRCQKMLGNPQLPLWITEGSKKADALASKGAYVISVNGVWAWRGKNIFGGTTILADFDYIAILNRDCYLVFDSDLSTNPKVHQALSRLAEHLSRKGARAHLIFLPAGTGGEKVGVDDYLAQGHTLDEVKSLETNNIPWLSSEAAAAVRDNGHGPIYGIVGGQLCWHKSTTDGPQDIPLANFSARIKENVLVDDGVAKPQLHFRITGNLDDGRLLPTIDVPASGFNSLQWVVSEWGAEAVINAGTATKDRLRAAIQEESRDIIGRRIFMHTGWREIGEERIFLHADGAVFWKDINVELPTDLSRYRLLVEPYSNILKAIRQSYDFLMVGSLEVTLPLLASMYLAPLSDILNPAFTLWLVGPSGAFKSTLTALALSHFGNFDEQTLPTNWSGTQNELEHIAAMAKDVPLVIDDYAPGQDYAHARQLERKAETLIRAIGNHQARGRMRADTSSATRYIPRCLLVTSGELMLRGYSANARVLSVPIEKDDVYIDQLTAAQGEKYLYVAAMTSYIDYLRQHWQHLKETLPAKWRQYRAGNIRDDQHSRIPSPIAHLLCAVDLFNEFALEMGALTTSETVALRQSAGQVLEKLAEAQGQRVEEQRPSIIAKEAWEDLIATGKAIIRSKDDTREPAPHQTLIGWWDADNTIYLIPSIAHEVLCRREPPFTWSARSLWEDLARDGRIEPDTGRNTTTVWINGSSRRVVKVKPGWLNV